MELIDARPANAPNDTLESAHSRSRYHFEEVGANTLRIKGEGRTTVMVELACAGRGFGVEYARARPFDPKRQRLDTTSASSTTIGSRKRWPTAL